MKLCSFYGCAEPVHAKGRCNIVHHLNGNKRYNRPENLEVMTQSQHTKLHHAEMLARRKAIRGY